MAETMRDLCVDSFDSDEFMDANDTVGPPRDGSANTSMEEKIKKMADEAELTIEVKANDELEVKKGVKEEVKEQVIVEAKGEVKEETKEEVKEALSVAEPEEVFLSMA